jgi:hypothetical protein
MKNVCIVGLMMVLYVRERSTERFAQERRDTVVLAAMTVSKALENSNFAANLPQRISATHSQKITHKV